ncbi:hypothetical protein BH20CHL7_BH20CHL7_12120 [soil metagenome]
MASRIWLTGGLILGLAALLVAATVAEANEALSARVYEDELVTAGYSTLIIERSDQVPGTPLSTADCAAIAGVDGVGPVLSVRQAVSMPGWAPRGPDLTVMPVGGDIVAFVGAIDPTGIQSWRTAQTFVDRGSSASSGSSPEYPLPLFPLGRRVDTTAIAVELDALGPGASGALLVADSRSGRVDACALFVASDFRDTVARSIQVAFPAVSGFSQRWALTNADRFSSPRDRFEGRPTKHIWIASAAVFTGFWLFYLRLRRSEHGLYAVIGLSPVAITVLTIIELLAIALTASILAAVVIGLAAVRADTLSEFLAIGAASGIRTLMACVLISAVWSAYAASRTSTSTIEALKDL